MMEIKEEIPCAACQSWKSKTRKFSCEPNECRKLTVWLLQNAPQLIPNLPEIEARLPEKAVSYVV